MPTKIGDAYVQIHPQAKGIQGELENVLDGAGALAGEKAGFSIAGGMKKIIGGVAAAGVVKAVGNVIGQAINEAGMLQQSYGGLETIYGDASAAAKEYAADAYKMGLSANDYAEQAVSFGASLKQAFGGDTQKAVEAANTAISDMTDNAAKMGTPIENIQNAYQGFAKQNYTMLDNLKLGYGGTKTEMERLLKDAQELTGKEYNIENLGDVYDAIHAIQGELGLTGVAADEAATTLSGSAGAMKAAWHDLLGNMGLGEDIAPSLENLAQTASVWLFDNFIPLVMNVVKTIPKMLYVFLKTGLPILWEHGKDLVKNCIKGIKNALPGMKDAGKQLITGLWNGIKNAKDWLQEKIKSWVGDVLKFIKGLFGIKSPSKVMADEVGKWIPAGAGEGVLDNAKTLYGAVDKVSSEATKRFQLGTTINASSRAVKAAKVSTSNNKGIITSINSVRADLTKLGDRIESMEMVMDGNKVVGAIASRMDNELGNRQIKSQRGVVA